MGLIISPKDTKKLKKIAERERAPLYIVGEVTCDERLIFKNETKKEIPIDLDLFCFIW